jgi:hypothetical protein
MSRFSRKTLSAFPRHFKERRQSFHWVTTGGPRAKEIAGGPTRLPLPHLNHFGELPEGVHRATITEVVERFGSGSGQRQAVTGRLQRIYRVAHATRRLERMILFGSYVTAKPAPNDIDVVLVMEDDFDFGAYDAETSELFNHLTASKTFGASVFWILRSLLILGTIEEFAAYWQTKRDGTRRGIVEVRE